MISLFSCYQTLFHIIYLLQLLSLQLCFFCLCIYICERFLPLCSTKGNSKVLETPLNTLSSALAPENAFIFSFVFSWFTDLHNNGMHHHMFSFHFLHSYFQAMKRKRQIFRKFNQLLPLAQLHSCFICDSLLNGVAMFLKE